MASGSFIYGQIPFTETPPQWFVDEFLKPINEHSKHAFPIKTEKGYILHRAGNEATFYHDDVLNCNILNQWLIHQYEMSK